MFCALLGQDIRCAFTGPLVLWLYMRNKDAAQLRGDLEADQRLYFRYTDSSIPVLSESDISSL